MLLTFAFFLATSFLCLLQFYLRAAEGGEATTTTARGQVITATGDRVISNLPEAVAGEGEGVARAAAEVEVTAGTGMNRATTGAARSLA